MPNTRRLTNQRSPKSTHTYLSDELLAILQKLHHLFYGSDSKDAGNPNQKLEQQAYWRLAKLMEESGELAEAIHAYFKHQRKAKDKNGTLGSKEHLAEELVDVIMVVGLIAMLFKVDLNNALNNKIKKIRQRMLEKYGVDILN